MRPKFLTLFYYKDIGEQHLYKDVGSIPLALAKYCDWQADFAYVPFNGILHDTFYEQHVRLIPIKRILGGFISVLIFLWNNVKSYDVINVYHFGIKTCFLTTLIRVRNPAAKIYVKLDINKKNTLKLADFAAKWYGWILFRLLSVFHLLGDIYTFETKLFASDLARIPGFKNKCYYLPNGFWKEDREQKISNMFSAKKNIVLSVGRIGAYEKDTELLIHSFASLPKNLRQKWKLILVGPYTAEIFQLIHTIELSDADLKGRIILTGNIINKSNLNKYYKMASIYCLSSRWESFGIALLEAIHHGCYPVVTDCCAAFEDILDHRKNGKFVSCDNEKEMSLALQEAMIDTNLQIKANMAKSYVDENYDWENIIKKLKNYLTYL